MVCVTILVWKLCKSDCSFLLYRELKPHWPGPTVPVLRITTCPWIPAPPLSAPPWLTVLKIIIFPWAQGLTISISQDSQRHYLLGRAAQRRSVSDLAASVTLRRRQSIATLNPTGQVGALSIHLMSSFVFFTLCPCFFYSSWGGGTVHDSKCKYNFIVSVEHK